MSDKPEAEKPKKVIASQHETYGVSTIIALLVPLAGIIMGVVYLTKEKTLDRKLGEHLVAVSIFSSVIFSALFFFYGQSVLTPHLTTEVTPAAYTAPAASPAPAWDIEGAYAKISNGMTREAVESAIGKSAKKPMIVHFLLLGKDADGKTHKHTTVIYPHIDLSQGADEATAQTSNRKRG